MTRTRIVCALVAASGLAMSASAGTWSKLTHTPPAAVNLMLLMSDGTVLATTSSGGTSSAWLKLTPAPNGNYTSGSWSFVASSKYDRLYFASQVMWDGRLFVAGGEYGAGTAAAEVYDPTTNTWTEITPPTTLMDPSQASPVTGGAQCFFDANSEILPDGRVLVMPVQPMLSGVPLLYNPTTNTWANGAKLFRGVYQDESSWVKLKDNSILTIDPFGQNSERYIPALSRWVNDGVVPVQMYDSFGGELGGSFLLPSGKAFVLGGTGHTAIYTPSGTNLAGTWTAGPDMPNGGGTPDAPACMMTTGNILCAISPAPTSANHFPSPTSFYEYDPTANAFVAQPAPGSTVVGSTDNVPTFVTNMLALPDGSVLYSHMSNSVYQYKPSGTPLGAGKPTVTSITKNSNGSYHLVGTGLNGLSEGACYGDDAQMASNYPLVRFLHSNGLTYYGRTYLWNSTGVQTGTKVVTTEYAMPASMPTSGTFSLVVVANGFASDPVTAPTISQQPGTASSCPGGSVSLAVQVSGVGPYAYQWRRGTTVLSDGGDFSGTATATLAISPAGVADSGTDYNCVVTNAIGSVTSDNGTVAVCGADFNCDGFVDFFDFSAFVSCFEGSCTSGQTSDYNGDGFTDFFDFSDFVAAFEAGC